MTDRRETKSPRVLHDPPPDTAGRAESITAPAASEGAWEDPWADEARATIPVEALQRDLSATGAGVRAARTRATIASELPRRSTVASVPTAAPARAAATLPRPPPGGGSAI